MAAVFLMQPIGQLMAQLVGILVLLGLNYSHNLKNCTHVEPRCQFVVDKLWRFVAGVGAIPCVIAIFFRWTITDPGRYTLDVKNQGERAVQETDYHYGRLQEIELSDAEELDGTGDLAVEVDEPLPIQFSWGDIKQYFIVEGNWCYLAGTSMCWFVLDFAFYGLGVNNPRVIATLWTSQPLQDEVVPDWISDPSMVESPGVYPSIYSVLIQNGIQSIVTASIGSLLGSLLLIKTINYLPRKALLAWSFLLVALLLLMTGGAYLATFHNSQHAITIVLYGVCQLLFNLGTLLQLMCFSWNSRLISPPPRTKFSHIHCKCLYQE